MQCYFLATSSIVRSQSRRRRDEHIHAPRARGETKGLISRLKREGMVPEAQYRSHISDTHVECAALQEVTLFVRAKC